MSIYPKVTEQDLVQLGELAGKQKNERQNKIKKKFFKKTHGKKNS